MRINQFLFAVLLISVNNSYAQISIGQLVSDACDCAETMNLKYEYQLRQFNKTCIERLLEDSKDEISIWEQDTASYPNYMKGYVFNRSFRDYFKAELVLNCDKFYKFIKKSLPNKIQSISKFDQAAISVDSLTKYINLDVNLYNNYCQRASIYYAEGKTTKALTDLSKAINLNSNEIQAYLMRGYIYHNKNDFDLAYQDFRNAYRHTNSYQVLLLMSLTKRKME